MTEEEIIRLRKSIIDEVTKDLRNLKELIDLRFIEMDGHYAGRMNELRSRIDESNDYISESLLTLNNVKRMIRATHNTGKSK